MTDFKNLTCFVRFSDGGEGIKQKTNHRKKPVICSTFSNIGNFIKPRNLMNWQEKFITTPKTFLYNKIFLKDIQSKTQGNLL